MTLSEHPFNELNITIEGRVALLTMNNPPVNALSRTLSDELTLALDVVSLDDEVRAVVITGNGKVFCAGADLKGRQESLAAPGGIVAHSRRTRECFHAVRECVKPVITAINGPALGSGLGIVASSDIILASNTACLGLPEIDVGLMGGARHAMRLFGQSLLRRMVLTGYRVPASELYRLGIVEACLPPEQLLEAALAIAQEIAGKSPTSVVLAKHTLNTIEDMSLRDGYRYEQDMTARLAKTDDAAEAQRAFREKRKPVFTGR